MRLSCKGKGFTINDAFSKIIKVVIRALLLWHAFEMQVMNQQQEFELLKERMLTSYASYMDAVRDTAFDDLNNINTRIHLMEAYTESVRNNLAYRNFLHKHKELQNK